MFSKRGSSVILSLICLDWNGIWWNDCRLLFLRFFSPCESSQTKFTGPLTKWHENQRVWSNSYRCRRIKLDNKKTEAFEEYAWFITWHNQSIRAWDVSCLTSGGILDQWDRTVGRASWETVFKALFTWDKYYLVTSNHL